MLQILEPVDATYVIVNNEKYTDCFESSLLRYIHIIFGRIDRNTKSLIIDTTLMGKYGAKKIIIEFFNKYNTINTKNKYYSTKKGMEERIEWCSLLNTCKLFDFVQPNYELKSCLKNIHIFFDFFIPLYRFNHKYTTNLETDIDCSIYPKCKGKKIFITDRIKITLNYEWVLTQFFDPITIKRITGHSEIYKILKKG